MLKPLLLLHIFGAVIGLLSGFLAMMFRKGSGLHNAAGTVFFVSMMTMSTSAVYVATFLRPVMINVVAGLLTFYLVLTAWWTARRRQGGIGPFEIGAMLFVSMVALLGLVSGFQAANSPGGVKDTVPAPIYFVFGSVAVLFTISDVRNVMRGGATGAKRIARHLWRMSLALLIATLSFYPGQGRLFPAYIKKTNLLFLPHVLLIGAMLLWLVRVRGRRTTLRMAQ